MARKKRTSRKPLPRAGGVLVPSGAFALPGLDVSTIDFTATSSTAVTSSIYPASLTTGLPTPPNVDVMFRVTGNETAGVMNYDVAVVRTGTFFEALSRAWRQTHEQQVSALLDVVHWQHGMLDYNAHYNAYLLEQMSQEEFEAASRDIAYEPIQIAAVELVPKIKTVMSLTDIDYTPSDFASLFRCREETVQHALDIIAAE
jgi:hypothetical protein